MGFINRKRSLLAFKRLVILLVRRNNISGIKINAYTVRYAVYNEGRKEINDVNFACRCLVEGIFFKEKKKNCVGWEYRICRTPHQILDCLVSFP